MQKKNILFVMSSLRNGGAERSLVNLLKLFDYDRYSVDLILFQPEGMFLSQLPSQVKVIDSCVELHTLFESQKARLFNWKHPYLSILHIVSTIVSRKRTPSSSEARQYRWVHYYKKNIPALSCHYDVALAYIQGEQTYYLVDKVNADKKIAWVHTDYSKIEQNSQIDRMYFSQIDKIVSVSDLCVDILKKEFTELQDKFVMLPNLTSSQIIRDLAQGAMPKEYDEKALRIVSVGRLVYLKGFDLALEAAAILKKRGIGFKWYILGIGKLQEQLERQRNELGLNDCFYFLGAKENPYLYMKNADIVVQSSRFEGKSVVLDEAKILGCPIVVTNYPTVHDQITSDEGVITEMTPEGIANGVEGMLGQKAKFSEFLLSNDYDNHHEIQEYYNIIED